MKCLPIILLLLTAHTGLQAQVDPPERYNEETEINSITTWTATAPIQNPNVLVNSPLQDARQVTQFFDGLGRPFQTVAKQGSLETATGNNYDLVSPVVYDGFGREEYKYLPFPATDGNGDFKRDPFEQQSRFYGSPDPTNPLSGQGEAYYYGRTDFEASPLNRVIATFAPGNSWVGSRRGVQQKYWINTEIDDVKLFAVQNSSDISVFGTYNLTGTYAAGELFKSVTTDENGKQVISFTDKEGKTVLKKVQLEGEPDRGDGTGYAGWLCTYYIYDALNNLRAVVQPEGVTALREANWDFSSPVLDEQCFRYEYDKRNRMVMKKVPGAQETYMVYDALDRLVMTQDGNMHRPGKWLVTAYDGLNRPVKTQLLTGTSTFAQHSEEAAASTTYPSNGVGSYELLTQTGYDDYTNLPAGLTPGIVAIYNQFADGHDFPYPDEVRQNRATTNRGQVTWTQVKVLNSNPAMYLNTVTLYDEKGRVIQTQSQNLTGGTDITTTQYTWAGQPLIIAQQNEKAGHNAQTTVTVTQMIYDDLGRVVRTQKRLSNTLVNHGDMTAFITTAAMQYDALGQLKKKTLEPAYNGNASLDYSVYDYNIRGWLLGVNRDYVSDVSTANPEPGEGEGFTTPPVYEAGRNFGFDLGYDKDGIIGGYGNHAYNGNIGGMVWKSVHDGQIRKYDFTYDAANRLLTADFTQWTSGGFNRNAGVDFSVPLLRYDGNGNITAMTQTGMVEGVAQPVDILSYTYKPGSNQLVQVEDGAPDNAASKLGDFQNGVTAPTEYSYDANGNLKRDDNKGIRRISYNYLNLVQTVGTDRGTITYTYDAAGNKLQKTVSETSPSTVTTTTLYGAGIVYQDDELQFIGQEEGRIRVKGNEYVFDYFLKDHLGNVRMVLTDDAALIANPVLEATSYYPFGLTMSGISSKAAGSLINRRKFDEGTELQSGEFSDGSGLELYATNYRSLDPQLGRFWQIDPYAESSVESSPFTYGNNNPIKFNDPLGLMGDTIITNHPETTPGFNGNTANLQGVTVKSSTQSAVAPYLPYIHFPNNRPAYIASFNDWPLSFKSRSNDLLDSWAQGYGAENRVYLPGHPMTKRLMNAYQTNQARMYFYKTYLANFQKKLSLKGGHVFLPGNFGIPGIIMAGTDLVEQFVGGMDIDIHVDESGENMLFIVNNKTGMRSAAYHMADDYERVPGQLTPGGNLNQVYIWSEPITSDGFSSANINVQNDRAMKL